MTVRTRFAIGIFCFIPLLGVAASNNAATAANDFFPDFEWKTGTVKKADLNCDGRTDLAILGFNGGKVGVAIFMHGLRKKPALLEFAAYEPKLAELKIEMLTDTGTDFREMLGEMPEGYRSNSLRVLFLKGEAAVAQRNGTGSTVDVDAN